jgi:hypothetical protein
MPIPARKESGLIPGIPAGYVDLKQKPLGTRFGCGQILNEQAIFLSRWLKYSKKRNQIAIILYMITYHAFILPENKNERLKQPDFIL